MPMAQICPQAAQWAGAIGPLEQLDSGPLTWFLSHSSNARSAASSSFFCFKKHCLVSFLQISISFSSMSFRCLYTIAGNNWVKFFLESSQSLA